MKFEVINLQRLKDFDLGQEFVHEVIQAYIDEIPQYLRQAEQNIQNDEKKELKRILHTLKSHSKTLGMNEISEKMVFWEENILDSSMENFKADFEMIKSHWSKAVKELESLKSLDIL